jgi:hypothetical protein
MREEEKKCVPQQAFAGMSLQSLSEKVGFEWNMPECGRIKWLHRNMFNPKRGEIRSFQNLIFEITMQGRPIKFDEAHTPAFAAKRKLLSLLHIVSSSRVFAFG